MGNSLPENRELEAAMLCVDGREFLSRLDWVRKELPQDSNAWTFLTSLAEKNPVKFIELVDEFSNELFDWEEIDSFLKQTKPDKIRAIKKYRDHVGTKNVSLKDAKRIIEERMAKLGV